MIVFLAVALWMASDTAAQTPLADEPGFVDFSQQALFEDDALAIHVSVKDPMIQLVSEATRESDPELADVLAQLKAVEVHVFDVGEDVSDQVRGDITRQARQLQERGWTEAISIRLRDTRGHVFLRIEDKVPVGLAALYHDGKGHEAVFVNIVGRIEPAQIGRLAAKLELDVLSEAVRGQMPPKKDDE
jgi:hypothetical protein